MRGFAQHPAEHEIALLAGGDLGALRRWRIARHVARCESCQSTAEGYARLRAELGVAKAVPEVDYQALGHKIRVALAQAGQQPERRDTWIWRAAAGMGLATAAVLLALLVPSRGPETSLSPTASSVGSGQALPGLQTLADGTEAQVTAEGRLSIRSFHQATGTLTITDYYAP